MSYPLIFPSTARDFSTLGNGVLSDAISCIVTENLNGSYELELKYPTNGLHAEYIQLDAIIVCQANLTAPRQAFRIYDIKQQINGIATINARHISYDLNGYAVEPFTATTLEGALAGLLSNAAMSPPFSILADFDSAAAFKVTAPSPVRSWFGGREGSILDIYGGEWEYDNFTCRLRSRRGVDNGVRVQYSKNIGSYAKELKSETIFSHVCAVWTDEETGTSVRSAFVATGVTDVTRVKFLDVSNDYQEPPTQAELTAYATSKAPDYRSAALNIAVGVIPMNHIQDVIELGDTVHVYYMNDIFATRCVTVVWNVLKEKYDSISVGALKTSLAASISNTVASDGYATKKDVAAMIQKNAGAVRITETGEDNGWNYIKYSNGTYEATKILTVNGPATTSLGSTLYRTAELDFGERPSFDGNSLKDINVEYLSSNSASRGWKMSWAGPTVPSGGTKYNIGTWVVVRESAMTSQRGYLFAEIHGIIGD